MSDGAPLRTTPSEDPVVEATAPPTEEKGEREGEATKDAPSASPREEPIRGQAWVHPRRLMLIVAFALSLALLFGTAAALFRIPGTLPVASGMALVAGLLEVPPLLTFVAGLERRTVRLAPLLLLSGAGGVASYYIGGSVSVGSSTTLGAGVIALVLFLSVGHRRREGRRSRLRRVHRWSRNAALLGVVLLLCAGGLYEAYTNSSPVAPYAQGNLTNSQDLAPGGSYSQLLPVSPGDQVFLLLGASSGPAGVEGNLTDPNGTVVASIAAGSFVRPNVTLLPVLVKGGTYTLKVLYPAGGSGPGSVTIQFTVGVIPAGDVILLSSSAVAFWCGFLLAIVGVTLWVVSRPPPKPEPPLSEAEPGTPTPETGEGPKASAAAAQEPPGAGSGAIEEKPEGLPGGPLGLSDEGRTTTPDDSSDTSSGTLKY